MGSFRILNREHEREVERFHRVGDKLFAAEGNALRDIA
jgi:hypothetical protein